MLTMKNLIFCVSIALLFGSCGQKSVVYETRTPEEKWQVIQKDFMVSGAPVSDERPLPDVLSEKEVLLKAADVAVQEGVLDPSYYAYQNNPALKDAKIETPILLTDAATGVPDMYLLNAVDADGISLASISVSSAIDTDEDAFERGRSIPPPELATVHIITKREATELVQSQFPESTVNELMAIGNLRLGDDPYSHKGTYWYFTVTETERSGAGEAGEYILDPYIPGYASIPGGVSNRAVINEGGHPYLDGYRMAKLDTPLHLFDKLENARAVGRASFAPSTGPVKSGFTPVPLKKGD
jgi:hypothetical protein